ncbi:hypothetical protein AUEXF2481DRAFT_411384 [Aureobasidium subglaciale EXF-2481]|uniref:Uncharacterized protein n=1 Tax=Aureobasidium subglaciale (strain EXF-2481) TaxID=1043005 RepID=A0A074Z0M5_AURSE|nr:uncharacterized protein AUEXF2481DRAFT_411384 [Aureobasidium subglaciale EXF-2481]KEQ92616.1 hypothetical protein AUEXF2481DRAFT_411384 [Aureobasidium subglaciale EXF-2481]
MAGYQPSSTRKDVAIVGRDLFLLTLWSVLVLTRVHACMEIDDMAEYCIVTYSCSQQSVRFEVGKSPVIKTRYGLMTIHDRILSARKMMTNCQPSLDFTSDGPKPANSRIFAACTQKRPLGLDALGCSQRCFQHHVLIAVPAGQVPPIWHQHICAVYRQRTGVYYPGMIA